MLLTGNKVFIVPCLPETQPGGCLDAPPFQYSDPFLQLHFILQLYSAHSDKGLGNEQMSKSYLHNKETTTPFSINLKGTAPLL
jgi:hypothetical protein